MSGELREIGFRSINMNMRYPSLVVSSLLALVLSAHVAIGAIGISDLRCEYLANPQGIDATQPRLSWILNSEERGQRQIAYQVLVASTPAKLAQDHGDLW